MPEIQNRFTSGMVQDALLSVSNAEAYRMARNAIHESREATGFGLVNEESNYKVAEVDGVVKGYSHIEERNQTLLFVYNGGESELHLFSHIDNSVTFVASDKEFGCNWSFDKCEFLYGEFKEFGQCNELHVYWSSACIYHVVNIDEMLDPVRRAGIPKNECSQFQVFTATCGPNMSALPSKNAGSTLEGGSVRFALQFKDNDGNLSNVFDISQPVYLETEDNIATDVSNMSAKLTVDGLDPAWNDAIIYVIHNSGSSTTIRKMPVASYGDKGFTFEYYGQEGELVDVSVLINKSKAWLRGQDLIQHDGRMFFYNIKNERNLNYQKYANQIQVRWVEYEVSMEQQLKFHFPSLLRGEIYALAIVWKYIDGTYSPAFHIPGNPAAGAAAEGAAARTLKAQARASVPANDKYCLDFATNDCRVCNKCKDEDCQPCDPNDGGGDSGGGIGTGGGAIDGGAEGSYKPMRISNFDTTDQFERKRNPSELKDRPNESDKLEDAIRRDVNLVTTDEEDVKQSGQCHDNLYGCSEAEEAHREDLDDISQMEQNNNVLQADYGMDRKDPDMDQTSNLKDSSLKVIDDAVKEREYITRKKPTLSYEGPIVSGPGKAPEDPKPTIGENLEYILSQSGVGDSAVESEMVEGASIRGDNWVDSVGNPLTDEPVRVVNRGDMEGWESTVQYPDHKDCNNERFYPEGNVTHHRVPWTSESQHFVSYTNGVVNKYQPENYEYGNTYVRPMGLQLDGVIFPSEDDLPKPLCPKSPYKVVYVKRTDQNKSVFAKGWLSGTFNGNVYGTEYAYPRHGVNSFEHVDRMISPQGNPDSRLGSQSSEPIYTFHSPDTDCDNSYLPVTGVKPELALLGNGWRHGFYSKGKEPENDQWTGTRRDNRGARVSNNINHYTITGGDPIPLKGITYAPSNTVVAPASEMSKPLMNRYRESSIYLETTSNVPGDDMDKSFVGDVLNHFAPTECSAPYVALTRTVPDQYGSVEGLRYIDLGVTATKAHYPAGGGTAPALEGICGDTWIGPYSKRRTSYVSNKQGDIFGVPPKPGSPCRERSICDSPDDKIFQVFGIDHYPTKLPKSGDRWDPKNYSGLHTVGPDGTAGSVATCGGAVSKTPAAAAATMVSESDWYYPRTLKSLVHMVVESHVNPALMQTGSGSQLQDGKVYYPKLKDLYLDSEAPASHPWEESFLTRFAAIDEQPSKKQLWLKMMFRTIINAAMPGGFLTQFNELESITDSVSVFFTAPLLIALWLLSNHTLFSDRRINQILGIKDCLRDEEGGDLDDRIEGFEDAYCRYSWDYSQVNDTQPYYAFPLPYNTCDCDDCDKESTNNLIYHSNKQNLDSELDAYRSVKLNNYGELPAHSGKLQKLFIQGNGFYAHATDGIWMIQLKNESIPTQIAFQQSGTGELIAEPQMLFAGVAEGFAGTEHPNAAINTSFGYFFIDDNAKKIYRFNGRPEEISAYGMRNFFKENLEFCGQQACFDEKTKDGSHYALGWDHRHNRLLFTKYNINGVDSFTASYTPLGIPTQGGGSRGKWVSFHDYIPNGYLWDRDNFYSMDFASGQIWQHHKKGEYGNFYGKQYPFVVEFAAVSQSLEAFDFEYLLLDTEAEIETDGYPIKDIDATFNKVALWNSTQGTGILPIVVIPDNQGSRTNPADRLITDYSKVNFHKVRRVWRANGFKDLVEDGSRNQALMIQDTCQPIADVNQGIFDPKKINAQDFKNRILSDKHLNYRYILDNRNDMRLYVKLHKTYTDEKQIPKQD